MSPALEVEAACYTRGEVAFLLAISASDARELDEHVVSQLSNLSNEGPASSHDDGDPLPAIARWHDVHAARARVDERWRAERDEEQARRDRLLIGLRVRGVPEREIAAALDVSQSRVARTSARFLAEVLTELGGEIQPPERRDVDGREACLKCGVNARAILRPRLKHVYGVGKVEIRASRQSGLCVVCISPELRDEVADDRGVAW